MSRGRNGLIGRGLIPVWLLLPIMVLFAVGYVLPLSQLVFKSLQSEGSWSLKSYLEIAHSPTFFWIVLRTLTLAATVTLICLLVAYPLAYMISRCSPRRRLACRTRFRCASKTASSSSP